MARVSCKGFGYWTLVNSVLFAIVLCAGESFAAGRFVETGSMQAIQEDAGSALLPDGSVLIVGNSRTGYSSTAEIYDARGGFFHLTGNLASEKDKPVAVTLPNGKVLVTDGSSADLYDPATGTFSRTTDPNLRGNAPEAKAALLLKTGKVLITDGIEAVLYDPATASITATGSPQQIRNGASWMVTMLNDGRVLLAGGYNNSTETVLAEAELYDPSTGKFSVTGSMTHPRSGPIGATIGGSTAQAGDVVLAGGTGQVNGLTAPVPGAELYDPRTGQFTFIDPNQFSNGIGSATVTVLQDGRVLFAGGVDFNSNYVLATIYDPSTGTFIETPYMNKFRADHAATLLKNGQVLIGGGGQKLGACCVPFSRAELFDPSFTGFVSAVHFEFPPADVAFPNTGSIFVLAAAKPNVQWVNFYVDGNYQRSGPPDNYSFDSTGLSDGPHSLMVIGYTSSPSRTDLGSDSIVINVANHHVAIAQPSSGRAAVGCVPVTVQPDSSVQFVDNYLDGKYQNSSFNSCIDTTKVANGLHTISTTAFNSSDAAIGSDSISVHVANALSGEHARIVSPESGSGASATVPISVAYESGVQWMNLYIDGSYFGSAPPKTFNVDTSKLSNGRHTLSLRGFNSSGQQVATDEMILNVLN